MNASRRVPMPTEIETVRERLSGLNKKAYALGKYALNIYRPNPEQMRGHTSEATEILMRGGKRSGKTTWAAAHVASFCTGMPIRGPDGKALKTHWQKHSPDNPATVWIIGWDESHIGQAIYRMLFG